MLGILLKNSDGVLGLAVVNEDRTLAKAAYVIAEKRLRISFDNGDEEQLLTEIDDEFGANFKNGSALFIGHYAEDGFEGDPSREYHIAVGVETVRKRRANRINI